MADDNKPDDANKPPETPSPASTGEPTEEELAALGEPGKRALERIRADAKAQRERADSLATKAEEYDRLQEASKTEQQRKDERAAAAETRAEKAERRANQIEAAVTAGLPVTWAARLVGNTPEELAADAKALAEDRPNVQTTRTRRTTSDAGTSGDGPGGGMSSRIRRAAGRPE